MDRSEEYEKLKKEIAFLSYMKIYAKKALESESYV